MIDKFLKPFNKNHSIKEAVIYVFLSSPIVKPERFIDLIDDQFKQSFQKAETLNQFRINFRGDREKVEATKPQLKENIGFRFTAFSEGKTKYVLQGVNEENRSYISFHNLMYESWTDFYDHYRKFVKGLFERQKEIFINAISLNYVDSFFWLDESKEIDVKKIFNENYDDIPASFFNSTNSEFTLITEQDHEQNKKLERINIKVDSNGNGEINISHVLTNKLQEPTDFCEILDKREFLDVLNDAHRANKEKLKNLLEKDVLNLINLK